METLKIIAVTSAQTELVNAIYRLRVLCRQQEGIITFEKYPHGWSDEMDSYAIHFAGFMGSEVICSLRAVLLDSLEKHPYYPGFPKEVEKYCNLKIVYLSRVGVNPSFTHHLHFAEIMDYGQEYCSLLGYNNFLGDANAEMCATYLRMNWNIVGPLDTSKRPWDLTQGGESLIHKIIKTE